MEVEVALEIINEKKEQLLAVTKEGEVFLMGDSVGSSAELGRVMTSLFSAWKAVAESQKEQLKIMEEIVKVI